MTKTGIKSGRLFFAIVPASEQRQQLFELAKSIRFDSGEKVTAVDMMHMTLRYIGPVDLTIQQCLNDAVSQLQASAFSLRLNIIDFWKKPQVTWVGPGQVDEKLAHLVDTLEMLCQACGIAAETRPYIPHMTLLRKSSRHPAVELPTEIVCPVKQFVLIESISTSEGVKYVKLGKWLLS